MYRGGMQIRFCYALTAWLYYTQNKFSVLPRVGIFPIQYKVVLKIAPPKFFRFTPCDISATLLNSLKSFRNSFFHFILVFAIMHISKRRKQFSGFLFCLVFCGSLYTANAYIVADCKRHRKQDKIGNDFSGFSKCSDLISEQVKRKRFWLLKNCSAFYVALYTGFPILTKTSKRYFESLSNFFF